MDKNEKIIRRNLRKNKYLRKEKTINIKALKKEISKIQIGNNLKNIFIDDYPERRGINNE